MQRISIRSGLLTTAALLFLAGSILAGCGLVDAPPDVPAPSSIPSIGSENYLTRFFQFTPNANVAGTRVFYRIYADLGTLTSERASIQSADTANTQNGYQRLMDFGYQELATTRGDAYLTQGSDERIRIRLFDEGFDSNAGSWKAGVYTGSADSTDANPASLPLRSANRKGFSFFYTGTGGKAANPSPAGGDTDYNPTGSTGAAWYVNAYAASVGQDVNTYTIYYSTLADLGYIKISR